MGTVPAPKTVHRDREEFASLPISAAITTRGKELDVTDSVDAARRFFALHPVSVLPVLDGGRFVGVVMQNALDEAVPDTAPVLPFVSNTLPTVVCDTPAAAALETLDHHGAKRLIVLCTDNSTYVGLVCMRGDRRRLCVAAEPTDHASLHGANGHPS
jgi:CBS domain-containing protein